MRYAFVKDDIVVLVEEHPSKEVAADKARGFQALFDITNDLPQPQLGWQLKNGILVDENGVIPHYTRLSRLKFLERFTDLELANILAFSESASPYAVAIKVALRKQALAEYIDLSLQQTSQGVLNLVPLGLLTADRANAILNTPLTEDEKYRG